MSDRVEVLYANAITKARIISRRQLRQFLRGEIDVLPCSADTERVAVKQAIARALVTPATAPDAAGE